MTSEEYRRAAAGKKREGKDRGFQATQPEFLSTGQIADLAENLTGKRPSPSTITRWMLRGARGQRLPVHRIGGRLYTARAAALQWFGGAAAAGLAGEATQDTAASDAVSTILGRSWGRGVSHSPAAGRGKGGAT
jgi:hypothetical protein